MNYNDKLRKCTYYFEDSLNKKCYPLVKDGNFLSLLHVNAKYVLMLVLHVIGLNER